MEVSFPQGPPRCFSCMCTRSVGILILPFTLLRASPCHCWHGVMQAAFWVRHPGWAGGRECADGIKPGGCDWCHQGVWELGSAGWAGCVTMQMGRVAQGGDAGGGQEGRDARLLGTQLPLGRAHTAPGQALFEPAKPQHAACFYFWVPQSPEMS